MHMLSDLVFAFFYAQSERHREHTQWEKLSPKSPAIQVFYFYY